MKAESNKKKLLRDYALYFIGHSSIRIVTILLLPLLTHSLTKDEFGYFELINSTVLILAPLISLQLSEAVLRFKLNPQKSVTDSGVVETASLAVIVAALFTNLIYVILIQLVSIPLHAEILLFFNSFYLSNYFLRITRSFGRRSLYSGSNILYSLILVVTIPYFYYINKLTLGNILLLYSLANFIVVVFIFARIGLKKIFSFAGFKLNIVWILLAYSLPLLMETLNIWVMNMSDRFIIEYFMGLGYVGIYGVAYKLGVALYFLHTIFNLLWQEESFKAWGDPALPENNAAVFNRLARLLFSAFLILLPLFNIFIDLFVDPAYSEAKLYLSIILFGIVFSSFSSFFGLKYQASKQTKGSLYTSLAGALSNVILNIIFIPILGLYGAAVSTLFGFGLMFLLRLKNSDYFIKISSIDVKSFLFGIFICIVVGIINAFDIKWMSYYLLLFGSAFFLFFNKDFISQLLVSVKGRNE